MRGVRVGQIFGVVFAVAGLLTAPLSAQEELSTEDREAVIAVALDYIEGWHEANPDRMARSLHPEMAKRIAMPDDEGVRRLQHMGKETLVEMTRRTRAHEDVDFRGDVRVLDSFGGSAIVRVDAATWVDFLQIAKVEDEWLIINVLWELKDR